MRRSRKTISSSCRRSSNDAGRARPCSQTDDDLTDPTDLTLAEARDALEARKLSSRRADRAPISPRWARARALNAYIVETPEQGAGNGGGQRRPAGARRGRPAEGLPVGVKDLYATRGVHTQACSHILDHFKPPYESTVTAHLWRDGAVMLGKLNMDEFAMGSSNETSYYGPVASPWLPPNWSVEQGARRARRRQARPAGARRLFGRLRLGGGGAALPRRDGERHRRLDPPAGGASPAPAASSRPMAAARATAWSLSPRRSIRPGRSLAPSATRRSCCARWPAMIQGLDLLRCAGARLRGRRRPLGQGPDDRRAARNIASTA